MNSPANFPDLGSSAPASATMVVIPKDLYVDKMHSTKLITKVTSTQLNKFITKSSIVSAVVTITFMGMVVTLVKGILTLTVLTSTPASMESAVGSIIVFDVSAVINIAFPGFNFFNNYELY